MYDKPYMINPLCSLIRTFLVCGALGIFFFIKCSLLAPKGNEASEVDLVLVQRKTTSSHLKHKGE